MHSRDENQESVALTMLGVPARTRVLKQPEMTGPAPCTRLPQPRVRNRGTVVEGQLAGSLTRLGGFSQGMRVEGESGTASS